MPLITNDQEYRSPNRRHNRHLFYKYVTAKVAKIILTNRRMCWSSPLLFNDPFDITQELRLNFDQAELNAVLTERVASLIENVDLSDSVKHPMLSDLLRVITSASLDIRRKIARGLRGDTNSPTIGQIQSFIALKDTWKETVPTLRVLYLSELNDITSMWLHYAEEYKGVVLEFLAVDELDSPFLVAQPVVYQDTLPAIANPNAWVDRMLGQVPSGYWELFSEYQYIKTTAGPLSGCPGARLSACPGRESSTCKNLGRL